jgi:hypothetical protein
LLSHIIYIISGVVSDSDYRPTFFVVRSRPSQAPNRPSKE